jgi:hypothetical protein
VKCALAHVQLLLQAFIARLADLSVDWLSRVIFRHIADWRRRVDHFGMSSKELGFELAEKLLPLLL